MTTTTESAPLGDRGAANWLPLIRGCSRRVTPWLAALQLTPNLVTGLGLASGLAAAACFALGDTADQVIGAGLFFVYYLFDYCDGELARLRGMSSRFGAYLDDFADWIVHAAFFLALGHHASVEMGEAMWLWMGAAAAFGGTVSAFLPFMLGGVPQGETRVATLSDLGPGASWTDVAIFAFRGLARADFWLIVLGLALADALWLLLPAAAIGSQVFWLLYLKKSARRILT